MVYSHESVKCSILKIFSKRRFIHIIFERASTLSRAIITTRFIIVGKYGLYLLAIWFVINI